MKLRVKMVLAMVMIPIVLAPVAIAEPVKPMIECANHTHVFKREDCNRPPPFGFGNGGGSPGGLLGTLGRILHGLTGGIL